jgi:transposase
VSTIDIERIARLERQVEMLLGKVEAQAERITAVEAENRALRDDNVELRRRLGENSSNSSKPPSSDSPADRSARPKGPPSGKPRGAQRGHKGHKRTFLPPTSSSDCFPSECRRCGTKLPKRRDPDAVRHQVVDVPKIEPTADDYWLHRVTCSCGETTCGTLPDGVPQGMLGSQVLALIAVLTADGHMSRRKVRALLRDVFGLEVSLGTLSESEQIVSDAVAPAVEEARLHALTERVKHVDATTWYQAGAYRSLWTLATATVTVFTIAADGTRATLRKWIDRVRGVLVTDRGTQFDFWAIERRQICWAHLIRKFAAFGELRGRPGEIGRDLLLWSQVLLHSWHRVRDGTESRAHLRRVATNLRAIMECLLDEGAGLPVKGFQGACRNILEHREAMWRFVSDPDVDPTNNHAERELRGLVCWRRSSGGSQSERGNEFAANLKSVIQTCRKQRRHLLGYLNSAIHAALRNRKTPSLIAAA